jgi:CRP/FNR family transcriptional regulator, nitrogen fixation regulation protein
MLIDFTSEAIVNTTVWIAKRRSVFGEGVEENISSTKDLLKLITRNLHHVENHLVLLGQQTALEKLAAFLMEMDQRLQSPSVMILPMTRRDIADYLGLTIETVSRTFSDLQRKGLVSLRGGQPRREIMLLHRSKLAHLVPVSVKRFSGPDATSPDDTRRTPFPRSTKWLGPP